MKRTLALLALLLIASPAAAKLLVVVPKMPCSDQTDCEYRLSAERFVRMFQDALDRTTGGQNGGTYGYQIVRSNQLTTEDARIGLMVWNRGKAGQISEQFDAVAHVMAIGSPGAGNYRLDSLLAHRKRTGQSAGPQVPQLVILGDRINNGGAIFPACSTSADLSAGAISLPGQLMRKQGATRAWFSAGNYQTTCPLGTFPTGGTRRLISLQTGANEYTAYNNIVTAWRDSAFSWAQNDTMVAWEDLNSDITASHVVWVYCDGVGTATDSLFNANSEGVRLPAEGDISLMLMGLARLDSLTGGLVFDRNKLPLKLGVTLDAAFCRTGNRAGPGILPSDSNSVKGAIDSLAKINAAGGVKIKLTVGVNVDSMQSGSYTSELGWWRGLGGNVKFSPQGWRGTKTTTAGSGDGIANGVYNIADMLGFRRSRFFKGDLSFVNSNDAADGDTSVCGLMVGARMKMLTAGVRQEEFSHTLLPVMDDWSPVNQTNITSRDSMFYVARTCGGFSTIRSMDFPSQSAPWVSRNGVAANSATFRGVSNGSFGYENSEGTYPDVNGVPMKILVHNGYGILGAYRTTAVLDSVTIPSPNYSSDIYQNLYRVWTGLLRTREGYNGDYRSNYPWDYGAFQAGYYTTAKDQWVPHMMFDTWPGKAHILKLNAADFSGAPTGGPEGAPPRTGYWTLKHVKNVMDTINDYDGHTVVTFDWPENIAP